MIKPKLSDFSPVLGRSWRVLVAGGRRYKCREFVFETLGEMKIDFLIQGGAPSGVDKFVREWAESFEIPYDTYLPDWQTFGQNAGSIRNRRMILDGNPDLVVAFPGGESVANLVSQCRMVRVPVLDLRRP